MRLVESNSDQFCAVYNRIHPDILRLGNGARNRDPRDGGAGHRRRPRERGFGGDIIEPSQHQENGPRAPQRNRLYF